MLLELRISQLGLVDDLVLPVRSGLTVLTGETGAGKSMIAGALALLTGQPVPKELVRGGEELAWVEGVFDLTDRPRTLATLRRAGVTVGADGMLVLRREIRRNGRNRVLINGMISSLPVLQQAGTRLLVIQSQDQQHELSRHDFLRDLLDGMLDCSALREQVRDAWRCWREAEDVLADRRREEAAGREQLDLWRYQRDELAAAALDSGEEAQLDEALALKRYAVELQESAAAALQMVAGGDGDARSQLGRALQALAGAEGKSSRLDEGLELLHTAEAALGEAAATLERFLDTLDHDSTGLDELEERKSLYAEFQRKYRRDVPALLEYLRLIQERVARQEAATDHLGGLEEARDAARVKLLEASAELRERRRAGAGGVSRMAEEVIRPLALPDLELQFSISPRLDADSSLRLDGEPCRIQADGADVVELMVRPNKGERAGPVAEIASGGERSRIHLGLNVLRGDVAEPPLQLFDEIDAGLGMDRARPVAGLLRRMSARGQVVCITHLATMAVHGATHWQAAKEVRDGRTLLTVRPLPEDVRVEEVARLLGADDGESARGDAAREAYARDLLREARE